MSTAASVVPGRKPDLESPNTPFAFQTEWEAFMCSLQESKTERRFETHEANSPFVTGSDFEFDVGVLDAAFTPPLTPEFFCFAFASDDDFCGRQLPNLCPAPARSADPFPSMRQLMAAELSEPQTRMGEERKGRRSVRRMFGGPAATKSSDVRKQQKSKSFSHMRLLDLSPLSMRLHQADDDRCSTSSRSFEYSPQSTDSSSTDEKPTATTQQHDKVESTQKRNKWALIKSFLRKSNRSCDHQRRDPAIPSAEVSTPSLFAR